MDVDESNWTCPPEFVLDEIFENLALADLRSASRVCQSWRARASLAAKRWDRRSLTATCFQWEPVRFICASLMPGIGPRQLHASCYHPKSGKVYVFGGKTPTAGNPAHFNDLWSLDLTRRRWMRIDVQSSIQYPISKSRCSLNAWGDFLVLVGGSRSADHSSTREIHRFDTRKKEWTEMWSDSQAPGIYDHSSVVFQDFLIVIGITPEQETLAIKKHVVHVIDLKFGAWHQPPVTDEEPSHDNWVFWTAKVACTAVLLRPGCILLHPSSPCTDHSFNEIGALNYKWVAYLLHFDPNDLSKQWSREMIPSRVDSKYDEILGQIGAVQVNNTARLLYLASVERKEAKGGSQMIRRMEAFHVTVRSALRDLFKSPEDTACFYDSLSNEPFCIKDERNAYFLSLGKSGHQSDVQVSVEPLHPYGTQVSPAEVDFNIFFIQNSFLPADLRSQGWSVCEHAIHLHSRTDNEEVVLMSANLGRVEDEKQLCWTLCDMRGEAPPATCGYSFVSAGGQMVLHGGGFSPGRCDVPHSGGTYILNPVAF